MEMMIKSKILDKLKPELEKAAILIKKYIDEKAPILIRHHADADGFCGGVVLEQAILPLIHKAHSKERNTWYVYSRKPSITPFYSYEDVQKDLSHFLSDRGNYEYKKPLVIVVDNGSSQQDLMALKKLKMYDIKIIVVDHHSIDKGVEQYTNVFINNQSVGDDYSFSAGMIAAELANMINPKISRAFIAAVAGIADRVQSKELDDYIKLAKGCSKEQLVDFAEALDYEAYSSNFIDTKNLMHDFFNSDKQKVIISMLKKEISKKKSESLLCAKKYSHISKTKDKNIVIIPLNKITTRGDYPRPGKIVGLMHDYIAKQDGKKTVSLGLAESFIVVRATPNTDIDVPEIIKSAKFKFPHAQISGGGHKKAGSFQFVPAAFEEVKNFILEQIKK